MTPYTFYELKNAVVGIAGLGGLGSNVAVALTRLRIGKLILTDFDVVEESNLNRQNYFHNQIGQHKVDSSLENLSRIDPEADLEGHKVRLTPEKIMRIFKNCQVIAECFDRADQKQMLVETGRSKMKKTVVVSVSGLAGDGRSNEIRTRRISDDTGRRYGFRNGSRCAADGAASGYCCVSSGQCHSRGADTGNAGVSPASDTIKGENL